MRGYWFCDKTVHVLKAVRQADLTSEVQVKSKTIAKQDRHGKLDRGKYFVLI